MEVSCLLLSTAVLYTKKQYKKNVIPFSSGNVRELNNFSRAV